MLQIEPAVLSRVQSGEIVSSIELGGERGVTELVAYGAFASSPAAVWSVLDDCDNYVNTMPRVKVSKVLERRANGLRMQIVIDTPFPLPDVASIFESVHTTGNGQWKREWKQVNKGLMPNSGSWLLTSLPDSSGKTLAEYRVRVEPRIPLPKRIIHFAHKRVLPELFRCVEEHAAKANT